MLDRPTLRAVSRVCGLAELQAGVKSEMRFVLVAVGGAIGSTLRYALDGAVYRWLPPTFPFGTFVVNVTG